MSLVQPASRATPTGRAHHTASYHEAGRALLVFGGYASGGGGGYLNELWVLNLDSLEWWQPDVMGAWLGLACDMTVVD